MKEMLVVLSLMALITSAASMHMGACGCCHQQDHEKNQPQQHHPQQHHHHQQQHHHQVHVQQQHHQQHHVHVQQQPQQQNHEKPQQQHHQQYQSNEHEVPLQHQHKQPNQQQGHYHEQQPQQQQLCQQGCEQQPGEQGNEKQITRCGCNTYSNNQNLNNCHEFLRQQCNPLAMTFLQSRLLQPSNCQILQQHCCHELRQIEPRYLHQAIYNIVHSITHHHHHQQSCELCGSQQASEGELAMQMAAQHLPSMCGMYHSCSQDSTCGNKDARGVRN